MKKVVVDENRSKEAVGRRLVALRRAIGINAKEIADSVNVAGNTWSQWETGKRMADLSAMSRIWDKYGANLDFIFLGRTASLPYDLLTKLEPFLDEHNTSTR